MYCFYTIEILFNLIITINIIKKTYLILIP